MGKKAILLMLWITQFGASTLCWSQEGLGGIRGGVVDAEFDGPVSEALVSLVELNRQTNTFEDGHFVFSDVPAGLYTVAVSKSGYERAVQSAVTVSAGSLADVTVRLKGEVTEMEELSVRDLELTDTTSEVGLLNLRNTSLSFQDSISKDMMSRAGASDAASALRLVVGASVADGKYATVRGLSDRYVGTALNGIRVPSADPKKRSVHMDMFPSGTIESMSVSKTFTPDLPGDYTGGGVNIRTTGIPEKSFLKFSSSREINREFTGKPGYVTYEGAGIDKWGRDQGERGMPAGTDTMVEDGLTAPLTSKHDHPVDADHPHDEQHQKLDQITKSFTPAMGTRKTDLPDGNYGYTLSSGKAGELGSGVKLGGMGAFTYSQKYSVQNAVESEVKVPRTNPPGVLSVQGSTRDTGTEEIKWSMLGSVGIAHADDNEVNLMFLRNRVATDRASVRIDDHDATGTTLWQQRQAIQYTERSLDVMQLTGKHRWDNWAADSLGLEVDWFGAHNITEQYEPDIRSFKNSVVKADDGSGDYLFRPQSSEDPSSNVPIERTLRMWRDTKEDNSQYGVNVGIPFKRTVADSLGSFLAADSMESPWAEADGKFKMGATRDFTHRWYQQDSFYYLFANQSPPSDYTDTAAQAAYAQDNTYREYRDANPEALWTDTFTDPSGLGTGSYQDSMRWHIVPRQDDTTYEGDQNFHSGYMTLDLPLTKRFRVSCGARLEGTGITIDPVADGTDDPSRAFLVPVKEYPNPADTNAYYYTLTGASKEEARADIQQADWLRSMGAIYDLTPDMKIRGTWSQTIARPTFLEMAPVITSDYVSGENFVGNNDLQLSHIVNTDLRWEWFPKPGEVFAASIFHKKITNPIDRESFSYLGDDYLLAVNYPEGTVDGWELEARKTLDFLPGPFQFLSIGGNYTFIQALVTVPSAVQTNLSQYGVSGITFDQSERDMEGQPAYLWNVNVMYDIERWGTSAGLFYSVRGDMLKSGAAVGDAGATPNIYSTKLASVNFSLSQKFAKRWRATFMAKNLIDPWVEEVYRAPSGEEAPRRRYREGVTYSIQMGYSW